MLNITICLFDPVQKVEPSWTMTVDEGELNQAVTPIANAAPEAVSLPKQSITALGLCSAAVVLSDKLPRANSLSPPEALRCPTVHLHSLA